MRILENNYNGLMCKNILVGIVTGRYRSYYNE